jgi:hypothetical protein
MLLCKTGKQMLAKVSVVTVGSDITTVAMHYIDFTYKVIISTESLLTKCRVLATCRFVT